MFMWHRILIKNVLVILKSFLTFSSNFFFAQPTFVFHLWGDFCIVHVFIDTFHKFFLQPLFVFCWQCFVVKSLVILYI